jgi:hypothetical protein
MANEKEARVLASDGRDLQLSQQSGLHLCGNCPTSGIDIKRDVTESACCDNVLSLYRRRWMR